jgi:hypothetical protein
MVRVCGGLENRACGKKVQIWGTRGFCYERRRFFDTALVLSGAWNGAVAFLKLWRLVWVYSVECLRQVGLVRLDLQQRGGSGAADLNSILC